jgi:hypothetical protein
MIQKGSDPSSSLGPFYVSVALIEAGFDLGGRDFGEIRLQLPRLGFLGGGVGSHAFMNHVTAPC